MSNAASIESAWSQFCDDLKAAGKQLNRSSTPDDELTLAEGLRYLTRLTRLALSNSIEHGDPEYPSLNQIVSETEKFGCDNPDTLYITAALNPDYVYRVHGTRGSVSYLSFLATQGRHGGYVRDGFIDSGQLELDANGDIEIIISQQPQGGNWLPMSDATSSLTIRQTFLDRQSETAARLHIERVDPIRLTPTLTIEGLQQKLREASGFVEYCTTTFTDWCESYLSHTNTLPPADQATLIAAGLDPNIFFYRSCWRVDVDEALVIHIPRIPECDTWNIQVDNYWQESMDYRYFKSHINKHSAILNPDGGATIVIAHRDPGHGNWLNTVGHITGHLGMRYIGAGDQADADLSRPRTILCSIDQVSQSVQKLEAR